MASPKLLFVRCDEVETFGVAPAAVEGAGAAVTVWDALGGDRPPALGEVSGVVLFGSSFNVEHADEQPFIERARTLTLEALDTGTPFLGVCFGAQVLAWALGSEVMKAPIREIGYEPLRPLPAAGSDPLLAHYRDGDMAFQWHMDTFELPAGSTLLVTGDRIENQAFRFGDRAWGVQFHFEVDRPEVDTWLRDVGGDDLEATWGKSPEQVRAEAERFGPEAEAKGAEVLRRFVSFASDVVR